MGILTSQEFARSLLTTLLVPLFEDPMCEVLKRTRGAKGMVLEVQPSKDIERVEDIQETEAVQDIVNHLLSNGGWVDSDRANLKVSIQNVFKNILTVLRFIELHLLDTNKQRMMFLSAPLWGKYEDADTQAGLSHILLRILKETLPESFERLVHYGKVVSLAKNFEAELVAMGLISDTDGIKHQNLCGKVLTPYVEDIEEHIAQKQRTSLLGKSREIMMGDYLSSMVVKDETDRCSLASLDELVSSEKKSVRKKEMDIGNDIGDFFFLRSMRVSVCAFRIMELIHETMLEATKCTSAARATVLYHTCRDIFELFRSIVPAIHKQNMDNSPRVAMLFHNDCLYLSHHALVLAHMYRHDMPLEIREGVVTVDQVPLLRELGDRMFEEQIRKHKEQIMEAFSNDCYYELEEVEDKGILEAFSSSIAESLKIINDVRGQWSDLLPENIFLYSMLVLCNDLMRITLEVLSLKNEDFLSRMKSVKADLSMNEILQVKSTLEMLISRADKLTKTAKVSVRSEMMPYAEPIKQVYDVLNHTLTYRILKDNAEDGKLSELDESQITGLTRFLFANESTLA
eukprot:CAMPEP_0184025724 /NCGR_PEP_ID=MMETSP0954-20121128/13007_1 /TAXON_ID=627963 /ORGANISM="Aplanochytrium sp, Strain PBS07" /LENGTH=570 /DNA_ID=CAMNT_0026309615 /DNA_START=1092 /DNA_END=2804 /DNA_ORIENTATION=+